MVVISLLLCGYVTHRMGVCLWAGPQDDPDSFSNRVRIIIPSCQFVNNKMTFLLPQDSTLDIYSIEHIPPPSYESIIEYDNLSAPPPPYDCIMHQCIVVLDPTPSQCNSETKKYPVTVQILDEQMSTNYI